MFARSIDMRVYPTLFFLISLFFSALSAAGNSFENGYISDVQAEKEERFYEIFLFSIPPVKSTNLKDIIFNRELSTEFKEKYREKFGQLDSESIVYQPTKFSILDENRGAILSVEQTNNKRKEFAEFMIKRLVEWHLDNYIKKDPTMRPVYELKEKLSNVEVQVTKETKVNIRYSLSDNSADVIVDNPYVDSKLSLEMNPRQFGPGPIQEQKMVIEKQLDKRHRINTWATQTDGICSIEFIRLFRGHWSTNLASTAAYKGGGTSSRETKYLVGFSHAW